MVLFHHRLSEFSCSLSNDRSESSSRAHLHFSHSNTSWNPEEGIILSSTVYSVLQCTVCSAFAIQKYTYGGRKHLAASASTKEYMKLPVLPTCCPFLLILMWNDECKWPGVLHVNQTGLNWNIISQFNAPQLTSLPILKMMRTSWPWWVYCPWPSQ